MIVLVLTACPAGLRGDLTKWLMEIAPGVFVGEPGARIRDALWDRTVELIKDGKALLVYSTNNEQGLNFRHHHHDWVPIDFDGLTLILRPAIESTSKITSSAQSHGWARARFQRKRHYKN